MSNDVMVKYRQFVADHNAGMARSELCTKYRVPDERFDSFVGFLRKKGFTLTSPASEFESAHDIDFEIFGDDMQFVEVELDPHETAVAEAGAMMYMESGITMETIFGDGSEESQTTMQKIFGAGKRILTGESLFMTAFTNTASAKRRVAFAPTHPGKILPMDLRDLGGELICQKDAFLCAAKGVTLDIALQKRLGTGFFGGEGFILQRLRGDGDLFIHAGGMVVEKELAHGQEIKLDTGCLVAFQPSVHYDIAFVGSIKSALFGGEGLFFATLSGPGRVWLQSLPISRLANRLGGSNSRSGMQINLGGRSS